MYEARREVSNGNKEKTASFHSYLEMHDSGDDYTCLDEYAPHKVEETRWRNSDFSNAN